MELKLACKMNWLAWHEKTKSTSNLLHQSITLHQPLSHHIQNVAMKENLQWQGPIIQSRYNYTPLTFDLGIPLSSEQRIPTAISCPVKKTHTIISSPTNNDEHVFIPTYINACNNKHTFAIFYHDAPQRERRVIELLPFICRSPYLRGHRDIINDKLAYDIYCTYICLNSEELYKFNAHDKAHRLWIDEDE
ncbi:hypothetical protein Cgig2_007793 [Carnegiea gigantea]|uniref:Uncharacterized protein n=1 Tax=Carnegiea gigantea TaxID=171969 RepID=A0A9Q1JF80_9CARY|nr:hypothetical protein Cgig2_007793 [Carnegiea gigantea]